MTAERTLIRRYETETAREVLHFQVVQCDACGKKVTEQLLPRAEVHGGGFDIVGGGFMDHWDAEHDEGDE